MSISFEISTISKYCKSLEKERDDALDEIDVLRELLLEIRFACFSEYAVNEEVLKLIKSVLTKRLKYNHECWDANYALREDENNNLIRIKIANKNRAKVMGIKILVKIPKVGIAQIEGSK